MRTRDSRAEGTIQCRAAIAGASHNRMAINLLKRAPIEFSSTRSHLPSFFRQHYEGLVTKECDGRKEASQGRKNTIKLKSLSFWVISGIVAFCSGSGGAAEVAHVPGKYRGSRCSGNGCVYSQWCVARDR